MVYESADQPIVIDEIVLLTNVGALSASGSSSHICLVLATPGADEPRLLIAIRRKV